MAPFKDSELIDSGRLKALKPSIASWAATVRVRATARYSASVELSQLAKSAMKSSEALRSSSASFRQSSVQAILLNRG